MGPVDPLYLPLFLSRVQVTANQQPTMEKLYKQSVEWAPNLNTEGVSKGKKENVTKTTTNEISDLPAYTLMAADIKLDAVYGDHV
jgi:hypothetical protein